MPAFSGRTDQSPPEPQRAATAKRSVKIYSRMDEAMIDYERADG
ncbi:MAG: hypothetical protein OCU22_05410 [Canidatus Methanoxibalbensis ujae]|nr:hypothetical protein [Candidatus Methanoxibalbensis ujae]